MRLSLALFSKRVPASLAALPQYPASDVVTSLPGYNGTLPTPHYSGYLPVGKFSGVPSKLHYWFVESEGSVTRDPVVLWLNGGPGASGIIGFLTELGQLQPIPPPGAPLGLARGGARPRRRD